jgi:spore maturation protein CgeB
MQGEGQSRPLKIVVLGLSITSSWGNGHATTFRSLIRALHARGHEVLFLERDVPWYAANRDLPTPPYCRVGLYSDLDELKLRFAEDVRAADFVVVGSYVPDGICVGEWVTAVARAPVAFYDIDTPVTLAKLTTDKAEYLSRDLVPRYDLYLSFTGGPTLDRLEQYFGSPMARPLYCSVDPTMYYPEACEPIWDLGYMGTYSSDRQPALERLMLEAALAYGEARMVVAGPLYPPDIRWPENVERIEHLPPAQHREFYNLQRFTLNITRADMVKAGYSPSVRLFEAAACATPIISDYWSGLETFLEPGEDILVSHGVQDTLRHLQELTENERMAIGMRARERILGAHTAAHRATELEAYVVELIGTSPGPERSVPMQAV